MIDRLRLLSGPSVEPVTLAEVKAHLRITDSAEDTMLGSMAIAARQWCEAYTRRAFVTQSWQQRSKLSWPMVDVLLRKAPVASVTSVSVIDADGQAYVLAEDEYRVFGEGELRISDPGVGYEACSVDYVAGYGDAGADVPAPLRLAICQLVAHWHQQRGEVCVGEQVSRVPMVIEDLLRPYVLVGLGAR